ncbi:MAG: GNAT family N-acetyltransferase [Anaerolineales bacterium]|nr:GNAT family N-acetyltransferase [Anaerolineales bacterium]
MINVVPLQKRHVNKVAHLHLEYLRTPFTGQSGHNLLRLYYASLIEADGAYGYVASREESTVGFVCGVWDATGVHAVLLKQHLPGLLFWGMLHSLSRPAMLGQLAKRIKPIFNFVDGQESLPRSGYELRPIVVDPRFRGTGAAKQLVLQLIQDAAQRGFERLFLYTEDNNTAANAFYRKLGFEHVSNHLIGRTTYFRYELSTNKQTL